MREKNLLLALMCCLACACLLQACTSFPQQKEMQSMSRVFDLPYDQVWLSVEELLHKDLKCIFKKNDKKDGLLETEWVHRMDTEGRKRWMIRAQVRKVKDGVEVVMYKKIEFQDDVSKSIDKFRNQKKDNAATPTSGWKKTDVNLTAVEDLYQQLEVKLEN
ncbi:MAG: hypothetical protein JW832_09980 [Deltaproteobacteria bacterium]|nr:hypothetical protein [Deltaproteobacteria bacterium]